MLGKLLVAFMRRSRTLLSVIGKGKYLAYGTGLHIGKGVRLWAPNKIVIGNNVYIGKYVHIECNCRIGDYVLIANRVAMVGRNDHDFRAVGYPMRFAPWAGNSKDEDNKHEQQLVIETDVWIGYGAILLSGIKVGKGSIIAAGSVVTKDVPCYSILAGNPANVVGRRFDDSMIVEHEASIKNGSFEFSEKGYDYWKVSPGKLD